MLMLSLRKEHEHGKGLKDINTEISISAGGNDELNDFVRERKQKGGTQPEPEPEQIVSEEEEINVDFDKMSSYIKR